MQAEIDQWETEVSAKYCYKVRAQQKSKFCAKCDNSQRLCFLPSASNYYPIEYVNYTIKFLDKIIQLKTHTRPLQLRTKTYFLLLCNAMLIFCRLNC